MSNLSTETICKPTLKGATGGLWHGFVQDRANGYQGVF